MVNVQEHISNLSASLSSKETARSNKRFTRLNDCFLDICMCKLNAIGNGPNFPHRMAKLFKLLSEELTRQQYRKWIRTYHASALRELGFNPNDALKIITAAVSGLLVRANRTSIKQMAETITQLLALGNNSIDAGLCELYKAWVYQSNIRSQKRRLRRKRANA